MMQIVGIISPLILIGLLGYLCTKTRWFDKPQLDAISKLTFNISIPAFLFYQMAHADLSQQLNPKLFAAFYLPVLLCYLFAGSINHIFHQNLKGNNAASAVFALGSSYSNNIIVGLPILLLVLGEQVLPIIFMIVTFHSAMLFGITSAIAAKDEQFDWGGFLKKTFNNPLIISILTGLFFNLLSIELPKVMNDALVLIGKPAITLALFVLGASLAFYQVKSELKFISFATLVKLILLPSLVYIAAKYIFNLDTIVIQVLVMMSACPTGVNAYLVAKVQGKHQDTIASTVVLSTLISVLTIPLWLGFLMQI